MIRLLPSLAVCFQLCTCSGHTRYSLDVDCRDFIEQEKRSLETFVPAVTGLTMFFLPGLQLDYDNTGPDETSGRGYLMTAPSPQEAPAAVDLRLVLNGLIQLVNRDDSLILSGSTIEVYIGDEEADAIYTSGNVVLTVEYPPIPPEDDDMLSLLVEITRDDPNYPLIQSGRFRTGIRLRIEPNETGDVDIFYSVKELRLILSGYPFGFIP